jgi:hypothetical protein
VKTHTSLIAIDDSSGGRKTAIYTFFGGNTQWTDEMASFRTPICQECIFRPFTVQIALPSSYYLSSSQPAPIEYFVNSDSRWLMFSMNFLDGTYAQTLVCNFEAIQSNRQLLIFLSGVFVTLSITFALQPFRETILLKIRNKEENKEIDSNPSTTNHETNEVSSKSVIDEKKQETIKRKIDRLLEIATEDKQTRKQERFLSRLDGLNNAFLTLSIFLIGLFISQFTIIAANPMLSFPIITAIFAMFFSFTVGLLGILRDLNGIRIMAWSLAFSCLILLFMIFGLVSFLNYFHNQNFSIISQVITAVLILANTFLTLKFAKQLEGIFQAKNLEIRDSTKIKGVIIVVTAIFVIAVSIIISVIIFGFQANIF